MKIFLVGFFMAVSGPLFAGAGAADFEKSADVFFLPWIGKDYGGNAGIFEKRVFVVGASHYADGFEDCLRGNGREIWRAMTRNAVRDYLDPNFRAETKWKATYTSFINAVFGRSATAEERRRFFDSVVFFNYLQRTEGRDGNESRPEFYSEDRHFLAFREIVSALEPDIIIVWGRKVWNELSRRFPDAERDAAFPRRIRAEFGGRSVVLLGVRHPSVAFPREAHHELFLPLLKSE